ncbi:MULTISPECIES: hypothetical protein [unclassified Streptomyces]|uniref:hypothetical protein n=1 Tax=unclassified Streptomyces TaxID=2593676 RepID=UPI003802D99A
MPDQPPHLHEVLVWDPLLQRLAPRPMDLTPLDPPEISGPVGLAFVDVTFSVPKFWSVFGSVPLTTDDRVPPEENPPPDSNR